MTTKDDIGLDKRGERVLRFTRAVRNLSRTSRLLDEIAEMFESDDWRDYTTALGHERWRACEFDYFLIASDISYEDAKRAFTWSVRGKELVESMESDDPRKRRPLNKASEAWHSPTPETLAMRAERLGWTRNYQTPTLKVAPVSDRQRAKRKHGKPWTFKVERRAPDASVDERARAIVERLHKDPELARRVYQLLRSGYRPDRANGLNKPKTNSSVATP